MYAEAYVNVNQYDIVLDVLIVNQTRDTLQACTLELATLGDLKLVEKPQVIYSTSVLGMKNYQIRRVVGVWLAAERPYIRLM